jgi:dihydrofolate reductase
MSVTIIAALSRNRCIGKEGRIPWRLPEDMKRFKKLTTGHVVLMGRKTWESLPEKFRPLPDRINIVLTRQMDYSLPEGVERFDSLDEALSAHPNEDVYVIGGSEIYEHALPIADRMELTYVDQHIDGDAFFPAFGADLWKETARETHDGYSFVTYQRS